MDKNEIDRSRVLAVERYPLWTLQSSLRFFFVNKGNIYNISI